MRLSRLRHTIFNCVKTSTVAGIVGRLNCRPIRETFQCLRAAAALLAGNIFCKNIAPRHLAVRRSISSKHSRNANETNSFHLLGILKFLYENHANAKRKPWTDEYRRQINRESKHRSSKSLQSRVARSSTPSRNFVNFFWNSSSSESLRKKEREKEREREEKRGKKLFANENVLSE